MLKSLGISPYGQILSSLFNNHPIVGETTVGDTSLYWWSNKAVFVFVVKDGH